MDWSTQNSQEVEFDLDFEVDEHGIFIERRGSGPKQSHAKQTKRFHTSKDGILYDESEGSYRLKSSARSNASSDQLLNSRDLSTTVDVNHFEPPNDATSMDITDLEDLDHSAGIWHSHDGTASEVSMDSAMREFQELEAQVMSGGVLARSHPMESEEGHSRVDEYEKDSMEDYFAGVEQLETTHSQLKQHLNAAGHDLSDDPSQGSERSRNREVASITAANQEDTPVGSFDGNHQEEHCLRDSADFEVENISSALQDSLNGGDNHLQDTAASMTWADDVSSIHGTDLASERRYSNSGVNENMEQDDYDIHQYGSDYKRSQLADHQSFSGHQIFKESRREVAATEDKQLPSVGRLAPQVSSEAPRRSYQRRDDVALDDVRAPSQVSSSGRRPVSGSNAPSVARSRTSSGSHTDSTNRNSLTESAIAQSLDKNKRSRSRQEIKEWLEQQHTGQATKKSAVQSLTSMQSGRPTSGRSSNRSYSQRQESHGESSRPQSEDSLRPLPTSSRTIRRNTSGHFTDPPSSCESEDQAASSMVSARSVTKAGLMSKLKEELTMRKQQDAYIQQLQTLYDGLLAKHALAEVTIDQLRVEPKVRLMSTVSNPRSGSVLEGIRANALIGRDPRSPGNRSQGYQCQDASSKRFSFSSNNRETANHSGSTTGPSRSPGSPYTHSPRTTPQHDPTGQPLSTRACPEVALAARLLGGLGGPANNRLALLFRAAGLQDSMEALFAQVESGVVPVHEQELGVAELRGDLDKLHVDYQQALLADEDRRANGDFSSEEFDPDRGLEGDLFQLGMRLDELEDIVRANVRAAKRRTPFRTPSRPQLSSLTSPRSEGVRQEDTKDADSVDGRGTSTSGQTSMGNRVNLDLLRETRAAFLDEAPDAQLVGKLEEIEKSYFTYLSEYNSLKQAAATPTRNHEVEKLMSRLRGISKQAHNASQLIASPTQLEGQFRLDQEVKMLQHDLELAVVDDPDTLSATGQSLRSGASDSTFSRSRYSQRPLSSASQTTDLDRASTGTPSTATPLNRGRPPPAGARGGSRAANEDPARDGPRHMNGRYGPSGGKLLQKFSTECASRTSFADSGLSTLASSQYSANQKVPRQGAAAVEPVGERPSRLGAEEARRRREQRRNGNLRFNGDQRGQRNANQSGQPYDGDVASFETSDASTLESRTRPIRNRSDSGHLAGGGLGLRLSGRAGSGGQGRARERSPEHLSGDTNDDLDQDVRLLQAQLQGEVSREGSISGSRRPSSQMDSYRPQGRPPRGPSLASSASKTSSVVSERRQRQTLRSRSSSLNRAYDVDREGRPIRRAPVSGPESSTRRTQRLTRSRSYDYLSGREEEESVVSNSEVEGGHHTLVGSRRGWRGSQDNWSQTIPPVDRAVGGTDDYTSEDEEDFYWNSGHFYPQRGPPPTSILRKTPSRRHDPPPSDDDERSTPCRAESRSSLRQRSRSRERNSSTESLRHTRRHLGLGGGRGFSQSLSSLRPCSSCGGSGVVEDNLDTLREPEPTLPLRDYVSEGPTRFYRGEYAHSVEPEVVHERQPSPLRRRASYSGLGPNYLVPPPAASLRSESRSRRTQIPTASESDTDTGMIKESLQVALRAAKSMSSLAHKLKENLKDDISRNINAQHAWT